MADLHEALANKLTDLIENGEEVQRAGETVKVPASAALLGVAVRFLRDNNIEADGSVEPAAVGKLTDAVNQQLKDMEEDGELPTFTN
jgi:hypothetical protein